MKKITQKLSVLYNNRADIVSYGQDKPSRP